MPHPIPPHEPRSLADLRRHYEVERQLADRLRDASHTDRRQLYGEVYDELFRSLPDHPQLVHGADVASSDEVVRLQAILLDPLLSPGASLVEFGPGDAALACRLAATLHTVYVVEASDVVLGSDLPPNVVRIDARDEPLSLPDASVDVAFSSHFIEHLHPEDGALHMAEVARLLRPGGIYLCVTPNRIYGPHDVSRFFSDTPRGLHLREYSHGELADLMLANGFDAAWRLKGIGQPPRPAGVGVARAVEFVSDLAPAGLRRWILEGPARVGRSAPFRPLEQVVICGRR
jgi:SAM-dependent methyltransferase